MTSSSTGGPARAEADEPGPHGATRVGVLDDEPDLTDLDGAAPTDTTADGTTPDDEAAALRDRLCPPMPADGIWGWVWPIAVTVLAGILRFWRLGDPPQIVFDETYYAKDAYSLLRYGYERKIVDVPKGVTPPIDTQILDGRTDIFTTDPSYVVHPPVGKWMIAMGEQLFGLTPFGWRFGVAFFGTLTVLVLARLARRLFRSTLLGSIAGLLLALDGLSIVMSRTALLDGLLAFWLVCAFACLLVDRDQGRQRLAQRVTAARAAGSLRPGGPGLGVRWWRIAAGVCLGLAIGTKWSGLFVLALCGILILLWDIHARRIAGVSRPYSAGILYDGAPAFLSTVCVAAVTYVASWTGWFVADNSMYRGWAEDNPATGLTGLVPDALRSWWHYHSEVYAFHTGLTSEHPYAAHAFRWLFLGRPTQFEFTSVDSNTTELPHGVTGNADQLCGAASCARDIVAVGTPALWWAACLALFVLLALWAGRRDWRAGAILGMVAATYLPWFLYGDRPIFYFYAVAIAPFLVLAVTLVIGYVLGPPGAPQQRRRWAALAVGAYLLLVLLNTAYFYPVLIGEWVPYGDYSARMWFRVWI